jgi:hypothetical protein
MKFIVDRSLGRLAKWLRILGHDTTYYTGDADRNFLNKAYREERIVLSRKIDLSKRQFMGVLFIIEADKLENQLHAIFNRFSLTQDMNAMFTRCITCNELLVSVQKERIKERVPIYTYETQESFMMCWKCGGIFWSGTHKERAEAFFKSHIPTDRP